MGKKLLLDKIANLLFSKIFQGLPYSKYFKRKIGTTGENCEQYGKIVKQTNLEIRLR